MKDYYLNSDNQLLEEIKKNNKQAFEFIFRKYQPRLYQYALHFISDEDIAKDILQDCFVVFWEKKDKLESISISSLLYCMVRNSCLNYLKRKSLIECIPIEISNESTGEEKLYSVDLMLSPEETLLYEELKNQIQRALSLLSERTREIFMLSRFEGLKNREIAERLNISTTAVENHISKSLKIIMSAIKGKTSDNQAIILITFFFL